MSREKPAPVSRMASPRCIAWMIDNLSVTTLSPILARLSLPAQDDASAPGDRRRRMLTLSMWQNVRDAPGVLP
jgi:hypothetical protein